MDTMGGKHGDDAFTRQAANTASCMSKCWRTLMSCLVPATWQLLKPMYGQTDAPRSWFLEARDLLQRCRV
eukprot:6896660-Prorocentrum_lima.AAC.1